jgi:hypothetical protein
MICTPGENIYIHFSNIWNEQPLYPHIQNSKPNSDLHIICILFFVIRIIRVIIETIDIFSTFPAAWTIKTSFFSAYLIAS